METVLGHCVSMCTEQPCVKSESYSTLRLQGLTSKSDDLKDTDDRWEAGGFPARTESIAHVARHQRSGQHPVNVEFSSFSLPWCAHPKAIYISESPENHS